MTAVRLHGHAYQLERKLHGGGRKEKGGARGGGKERETTHNVKRETGRTLRRRWFFFRPQNTFGSAAVSRLPIDSASQSAGSANGSVSEIHVLTLQVLP